MDLEYIKRKQKELERKRRRAAKLEAEKEAARVAQLEAQARKHRLAGSKRWGTGGETVENKLGQAF